MKPFFYACILGLSITPLIGHNAPEIFNELDRETGGCEIEVKSLKQQIQQCQRKSARVQPLESELSDLDKKYQALVSVAEDQKLKLKAEIATTNDATQKLNESQKLSLSLALKIKELEGQLKENQTQLAQQRRENQQLIDELAALRESTLKVAKSATPDTTSSPEPVTTIASKPSQASAAKSSPEQAGPVTATANTCSRQENQRVSCTVTLVTKSGDVTLRSSLSKAKLYDTLGNKYAAKKISIGNTSNARYSYVETKIIENIATALTIEFEDGSDQSPGISKLDFELIIDRKTYDLGFRSVPISP